MKTSNKLLIILAVSLIIIPIIVVAVTVKMNYTDEKTYKAEIRNFGKFESQIDGFSNAKIDKDFNGINIADAKELGLTINLINSTQKGTRISDELKGKINFNVDDNGTLQISFSNKQKDITWATIYIYAPKIGSISVNHSDYLSLSATNNDSLMVSTTHTNRIGFNDGTQLNKLILSADGAQECYLGSTKVEMVDLALKNSNFKSESNSYKALIIKASGNSNIEIYGEGDNRNKYNINNLSIQTTGKSDLKLENIQVGKSSGSLSDSTTVAMSASILKTMFNK